MSDRCPACGKILALVGRTHRCVANSMANSESAPVSMANASGAGTYRYRDPEHRRAYQRELMRKRRADKRTNPT